MSIIVDGYNYIGRSRRGLRLDDPKARDTIISLFGQYCRKTRKSLTIVFDGTYSVNLANRKRQYGRVKVIYTSPTSLADDLIKKMIRSRARGQRQGLLIVTSDEEILQYAQKYNVAWIRSEAFEQTVQQALETPESIDRKNVRLSPDEVQKWMEIFGAEDEEPEETAAPKSRRARRKLPEAAPVPPPKTPPPRKEQSVAAKKDKADRVSKRRPVPKPSTIRKPSKKAQPPEQLDRVNVHLSDDDVEAWLEIFQQPQHDDKSDNSMPPGRKGGKKKKKFKR